MKQGGVCILIQMKHTGKLNKASGQAQPITALRVEMNRAPAGRMRLHDCFAGKKEDLYIIYTLCVYYM